MHENEQHDLSDDSDYAAAASQCQARGATRMMRSDSEKSASSDFGGGGSAEVVYAKDNVAIHPTQYASERIVGRLRLTKQGSSLFLSWIPNKPNADGTDFLGRSSHSAALEKDRNLYTIKAVPITDVHSIRRHTPTLGWQYIIIVLSSGLAYAPFYFYTGGVREFLATLRQHVFIVRSADDANVFLVNNFEDPLQRSLSSLELPRVVAVANKASPHDAVSPASSLTISEGQNGIRYDGSSGISEYKGRPKHKSHDPAHDISIQVLEKFSLVTKFAREATSHIFRESNYDGFNSYEKKHQDSYDLRDSTNKPDDISKETTTDVGSVVSEPLEFEKLPLVWGRQRKPPLSDEEIWKFLLGYHEYHSTFAEREYLVSVKKSEYEVLKTQWQSISAAQAKRFTKFRERKGLIDKDVVRTDRSIAYYEGDDNPNVMTLRDILLTYSFYNFDLGYCQGMSDLLSPILHVMEDEAEAFWCFVALMERLGPNFNRDQSGMHSQLLALSKLVELLDRPLHNYFKQADCLNYFFCFRWILIQFKREFAYDEVMRLWEVLWTHYLSEHFHLYICVAILKKYRSKIMGEQMDFDTLLKFINELSGNIDLNWSIREAESLCVCAREKGADCIPPGTPPSLPVETDAGLYPQEDDVL